MVIEPGSRLGPYEIVSRIGAGGMGEVFKARDTRLDRSVAIKVLTPEFASNAALKQRFEREARAVSQLNHPHICTLYDVGQHEGIEYLVMELIEGESLADRLTRGPLPMAEVLRYGAQVAEALNRAHRAGIVHRDLKPGNIMIAKAGAKLLDFGLAKSSLSALAVSGDGATEQKPLTQEGTILGTFQYMAPEQLAGEEADARTDIFALGGVLYEMATGKRAFEGKTRTSLIAAIIATDPRPISELQPLTPPAFEHVVAKCLSKDPDDRWQSAHDVAQELSWIGEAGSKAGLSAAIVRSRGGRQRTRLASAAVLLALIAGALGFMTARWSRPGERALRLLFSSPELDAALDDSETAFALSPDGKTLVYTGVRNGADFLFVRSLERFDSQQLAGTQGATYPFWSPDSASIGFFADGKLKKIAATGGEPQNLCDVESKSRGGSWSRSGTIIFAPSPRSGLFRIASMGGPVMPLTTLAPSEVSNRWPAFLPDGRHFLYYMMAEKPGIYLGSLDSKERGRLVDGGSNPLFVAPDILLYVRDRALVAQRLNRKTFRLTGPPVSIAEDVGRFGENGPTGFARFSASDTGVIAFQKITRRASQLSWRDRSGAELGRIGPVGAFLGPRLSPDTTRALFNRTDPKTQKTDVWAVDLARGVFSRLTTGAGDNAGGLWSPDGKQIVFSSERNGKLQAYIKAASSGGEERPLVESQLAAPADDWSGDGRFIVLAAFRPKTYDDIYMLEVSTHRITPFLVTGFTEWHAQFSPDSKWLAYTSDESGQDEVYVQSFPSSGDKYQVSTGGGDQAVWSRDGHKIYYLTLDKSLMEVEITTVPSFRVIKSAALFSVRTPGFGNEGARSNFDVMPDGQRFLVNTSTDTAAQPIHFIVNWTSELPQP